MAISVASIANWQVLIGNAAHYVDLPSLTYGFGCRGAACRHGRSGSIRDIAASWLTSRRGTAALAKSRQRRVEVTIQLADIWFYVTMWRNEARK